ncbi:MAG: MazG nucleotide pyrophosphohydrolase domain-containing protein [Nanoarchaeota archaeon]
MSLYEHQKQVDDWTSSFTPQYWPPLEQFARLAEEIGELARELSHIHGTKKKKPEEAIKNLGSELSDIIFTVICLANSHNINLQQEWDKMMADKMYSRDANRFEKKE